MEIPHDDRRLEKTPTRAGRRIVGMETHRVRAGRAFLVVLGAAALTSACDRTGQVSDTARQLAEASPGVPAWTFLTYTHSGRADTLWAGRLGGVVEDETEVAVDVGGRTDEAALREHLSVEPRNALDGQVRWSDYQGKAIFRLRGLRPGRDVYVTLRAGLPREGADPLPHDQVWRLRREEGATVAVSAGGPGVLLYVEEGYVSPAGPIGGEPVLSVPYDTVRLELRFSRAMEREQVEARIRAELERATSISLQWEDDERLTTTVVFPEPAGHTAPTWDSHHLELQGLSDARGLPNADPRLITFEVGRALAFHRWSEDGGTERLGDAPPRMLVFSHRRVVTNAAVLAWHFDEEIGDYWGVAPWMIEPATGGHRRLGEARAAYEGLTVEWLPGDRRIALGDHDVIRVAEAASVYEGRYNLGDSVSVLEFTVHPEDGRIAAVTLPRLAPGEEVPASLAVITAEGRVETRIPGIGRLIFPEASPESIWPLWLPDGRIAFLHRPNGRWSDEEWTPRTVAFVDVDRQEVSPTELVAESIRDIDDAGRLLLDGNRLFDPVSGEETSIPVRKAGVELVAISPDGEWIAGTGGTGDELGVFRRSDRSWRDLGRGTLIGWAPDGSLYWIGPAERR